MKKTALVFALITSLTFNVSNSLAATLHQNCIVNAENKVVSEAEIATYLRVNNKETLLFIRTLEGTEDLIAYTHSGKVFYVEIENSIIIATEEMPNN